MTQTHRGEGGIGGLSESYCPKCDVSKAFRTGWSVVKGMFENPGGFGAGDCTLCGEPFNGDNPSYESKEGNAFCKGCFRDRWRVE